MHRWAHKCFWHPGIIAGFRMHFLLQNHKSSLSLRVVLFFLMLIWIFPELKDPFQESLPNDWKEPLKVRESWVALATSPSGAQTFFSREERRISKEKLWGNVLSWEVATPWEALAVKKIPFESDRKEPFLPFYWRLFSTKGNNHYDKVLCTSNKSRSQYVCMSRLQG